MRAFLRELSWDVRGNRINVVLSFVALLVAMFSFVLIAVLSSVGRDSLVARDQQLHGRAVTRSGQLPTAGWSSQRVQTLEDGLRAWRSTGLTGSLVIDRQLSVVGSTDSGGQLTLRLVSPGYRGIRRATVLGGRWFGDAPYPGELVENAAARAILGPRRTVQLRTGITPALRMTVVGNIADGDSDPIVYASAAAVQSTALLRAPDEAAILVRTRSSDSDRAAQTAVAALLARVGIHDVPDLNRIDQAGQIENSLSVMTMVFLAVALIGLVVAVLGMVNVGVASVRERTRDLTIRRAMGATRLRVFGTVAAGTTVIGVAATGAAVALSYTATRLLVPRLVDPSTGIAVPAYPWVPAAGAAAIGLAASAFSGLVPALRTRSLDIAAVLRE